MEDKLQMVAVAELVESPTNVAGRTKGEDFKDLVASVREKGVLVPILVRGTTKGKYEVIAGNRRYAAAKEAGLTEIPAMVVDMDDTAAREAQIVENLQRKDLHPLDEGEAYRALIENAKPKATLDEVAARVGKSEKYVRQRLGLTNLSKKAAKAFREGEISVSQAILISGIEEDKIQDEALKRCDWDTIEELRRWIMERVYADYSNKPWGNDAKLKEAVGDMSGKASLFDEEGDQDPIEYARQMAAYIELKSREYEKKGKELLKICTSWGTPDGKGVLGRDQYRMIEKGMKVEEVKEGIVVEGKNLGLIFKITTEKAEVRGNATPKLTPEEKAKRKKEREAEDRKKQKDMEALTNALTKVKLPLSEKHLDALLDFALNRCGTSYQMPVVRMLGMEVVKTEQENYSWSGGKQAKKKVMRADYEATIRKYAGTKDAKIRAVFALLMPMPDSYGDGFTKAVKKL